MLNNRFLINHLINNWCLIILSSCILDKGIGSKLTSSESIPDLYAPLVLSEIKEKNMLKK